MPSPPLPTDAHAPAHRLVHLDLKGLPPTSDRLMQWLDVIGEAGYTGLLVEWEDCFPWEVDPRFRSETAYSRTFVQAFHREAQARQLDVMPLVQSLGHMEMVLRLEDYAPLREVPSRYDGAKPCSDQIQELVITMVDEVLSTMPTTPAYFHLGGDEAWAFGEHPDSQAFLQKHGKEALFTAHYQPLFEALSARDIRPVIWHDMLLDWSEPQVRELAQHTDLMAWGYNSHPDEVRAEAPHHRRHLEHLARCDVRLWGATAFKGARHASGDLPHTDQRFYNAKAWAQVARQYAMQGTVATGWSRFDTLRPQCYPTEGCLDIMAAVGTVLRDGEAEQGLLDRWTQKLIDMGYTDLPALKKRLGDFNTQRDFAWDLVRRLREQLFTLSTDPTRAGLNLPPRDHAELKMEIEKLTALADQIRPLLTAYSPEVWVERYLAERLCPLRQAYDDIEQQAETAKGQPAVSTRITNHIADVI